MLDIMLGGGRHDRCDGVSRRDFLRVGTLGALGLGLPQLLRAEARAGNRRSKPRARSVILVYLAGGLSHHDSFDLKPEAQAEIRGDVLRLTVVSPAGMSPPHELLMDRPGAVVLEKEPNNGFRQAQAIPVPGVVSGMIEHPQDVDVYRIDGKASQKLVLEVRAARYGSALDLLLTLYDADGRELAAKDDGNGSQDSRLEFTLPGTGKYYAVVLDANDLGSPLHVYRLHARWSK